MFYAIRLYPGAGATVNEPIFIKEDISDLEEALVIASIKDKRAFFISDHDERYNEIGDDDEQWLYLDRSSYGKDNGLLFIGNIKIKEFKTKQELLDYQKKYNKTEDENVPNKTIKDENSLTKSPYKSLIGEHFDHSFDWEFLDIVAETLDIIDWDEDLESEIDYAVESATGYYSEQWKIAQFYVSGPEDLVWDDVYREFYDDIYSLATKIKEQGLYKKAGDAVPLTLEKLIKEKFTSRKVQNIAKEVFKRVNIEKLSGDALVGAVKRAIDDEVIYNEDQKTLARYYKEDVDNVLGIFEYDLIELVEKLKGE